MEGSRKVTPEEIEKDSRVLIYMNLRTSDITLNWCNVIKMFTVKDSIERCILNYMKKKEVVDFLYQQQNIEPCFTRIIWQRLEEQNKQFFRNYYLRLAVKDQITRFNDLLEKQAAIMKQLNSNGVDGFPPMQPIAIDLPPSGWNNSFDHQFNTSLAQGMNNVINPVNSESGNLGNSGSVSSSSNMDSDSPQLERTFTADLSAFMSSYPDSLFNHSDVITLDNQGENNRVPGNFNFQNAGLVEMSHGPTTSLAIQGEICNGQLESRLDNTVSSV